ncbi:adenosine deaminase 2 [Amyelois transitella]|uniref:adenosine deaminase 2 n=1 Tax=Amyelois transitella TaxID=680683 RepID=UPI0029900376|nr:adenosine deaminase 2 [Amyelois transitella]
MIRALFLFFSIVTVLCDNQYAEKRQKIIEDERRISLGGNIKLTDKEEAVNKCIMKYKHSELDFAFDNPQFFNFSHHYFLYKEFIPNSKVFKIIKNMPKGAVLHVHDMGILGPDYLLNVTYMDNLYVCFQTNGPQFRFAYKTPSIACSGQWQLMSEARRRSRNIRDFDARLRKYFTLVVGDPDTVYPSITESWTVFMDYFVTVAPLLSYRPVWEQYFYDTLLKLKNENIMYVEVRSVLPILYELDGTEYDQTVTAKAYKKATTKFVNDYPEFVGAKLIYAPPRKVDKATLTNYLDTARKIKEDIPEFFAGFDLVGQEDLGKPLIEFAPQLLAAASEFNYFFHAGETDWYGCHTDDNLIDAILLGAKRIGHAYALPKHPVLMREVVNKDIGLEVNVISNAVLSLVRDVRNHPLNIFLANDLPVVLSSDDPGVWEADAISDDFYVAFVGIASKTADLRMLKALAINSLKYSVLDSKGKTNALNRFNLHWNQFINNFNCSSY